MECDRDDSFPFDFEPNGIPIQCERKWKYSFLSAKARKPSSFAQERKLNQIKIKTLLMLHNFTAIHKYKLNNTKPNNSRP